MRIFAEVQTDDFIRKPYDFGSLTAIAFTHDVRKTRAEPRGISIIHYSLPAYSSTFVGTGVPDCPKNIKPNVAIVLSSMFAPQTWAACSSRMVPQPRCDQRFCLTICPG